MSTIETLAAVVERLKSRALPEPANESWESLYYNSYGNYSHLRFQDLRAVCPHRTENNDGFRNCGHSENSLTNDTDGAECLCEFCPLAERAYSTDPDDPDADDTDYSEGEQPILML